uniref:Reverse transcriptase zinc-binding domain-containing protein n=1 Tax=Oryza glaberrima TaxID=4538 RepID=I1PLB1_ORYGL
MPAPLLLLEEMAEVVRHQELELEVVRQELEPVPRTTTPTEAILPHNPAEGHSRVGMDNHVMCPFYTQEPKTSNHILMECAVARQVWHKLLIETPWVPLPPIISTLHSSNQLSEQGTTEQVPSVRDMASTAKQAAGGGADRVDGGASGKGGKVRTVRSISHNPTLSFFTPFVEDLVDPVVKHIWRW